MVYNSNDDFKTKKYKNFANENNNSNQSSASNGGEELNNNTQNVQASQTNENSRVQTQEQKKPSARKQSKSLNSMSTAELYEKVTGKSWSEIKNDDRFEYDGSFEGNMKIRKQLLNMAKGNYNRYKAADDTPETVAQTYARKTGKDWNKTSRDLGGSNGTTNYNIGVQRALRNSDDLNGENIDKYRQEIPDENELNQMRFNQNEPQRPDVDNLERPTHLGKGSSRNEKRRGRNLQLGDYFKNKGLDFWRNK